jgi:hypothetical protein
MIQTIDKKDFIYYKDQKNTKSIYGLELDRIVEIPNFISQEESDAIMKYFESKAVNWGPIAFFGSEGMSIVHEDPTLTQFGLYPRFFGDLMDKYQESIETIFERKVKPVNICHAQKWNVGGNASPHTDNSSMDGKPNAFETNKFVSLLYLNDDYEGGELYFPELDIEFKPKALSWITFNGGIENLHGVKEIKAGTRYTFVSFWDFAEAEYDEATRQRWQDEIDNLRKQQAEEHEKFNERNKNK